MRRRCLTLALLPLCLAACDLVLPLSQPATVATDLEGDAPRLDGPKAEGLLADGHTDAQTDDLLTDTALLLDLQPDALSPCPSGWTDLQTDLNNCGKCGAMCADSSDPCHTARTCVAGTCGHLWLTEGTPCNMNGAPGICREASDGSVGCCTGCWNKDLTSCLGLFAMDAAHCGLAGTSCSPCPPAPSACHVVGCIAGECKTKVATDGTPCGTAKVCTGGLCVSTN